MFAFIPLLYGNYGINRLPFFVILANCKKRAYTKCKNISPNTDSIKITATHTIAAKVSVMSNKQFMDKAIELSKKSMCNGGGPFGAVIVKDGAVIGEGMNGVVPLNDPTAHAEVVAIRNACQNLATYDLSGSVIFTSCEPCPMCLSAIWWARIEKIYFCSTRDDAASAGFDDAAIYREISKNLPERTLPIEHFHCEGACKVFSDWLANEKKVAY